MEEWSTKETNAWSNSSYAAKTSPSHIGGASAALRQASGSDSASWSRLAQSYTQQFQIPNAFFHAVTPAAKSKLIPLNEWEGVVDSVDEEQGVFQARLQDQTQKDSPTEAASFLIEDVRQDDLPLLTEGAVFRWVIGKREDIFGGVERTSTVVFRRMPAYSQADLKAADDWATAMAGAFAAE